MTPSAPAGPDPDAREGGGMPAEVLLPLLGMTRTPAVPFEVSRDAWNHDFRSSVHAENPTMSTQSVLCIPRPWIDANLAPGLNRIPLSRVLGEAGYTFLSREAAEVSESFAHLATYAVLVHADMVFFYRRGESGGEGRLHRRLSIGVGGHVDSGDFPHLARVSAAEVALAAGRELEEEVTVTPPYALRPLGLIWNPEDEVGRVHLGAAFVLELPDATVTARENHLEEANWILLDMAKDHLESMEGWSAIILQDGCLERDIYRRENTESIDN